MKMYILVRDSVPTGIAITAAAHASLATYLRYSDRSEMRLWASGVFRKVICRVSDKEFEEAKKCDAHVVITESALDNVEVAIGLLNSRQQSTEPASVGCGVDEATKLGNFRIVLAGEFNQ